jgi:hypothetical protein
MAKGVLLQDHCSIMVCMFLLISHTFVGRLPSHMASEGGQHERVFKNMSDEPGDGP